MTFEWPSAAPCASLRRAQLGIPLRPSVWSPGCLLPRREGAATAESRPACRSTPVYRRRRTSRLACAADLRPGDHKDYILETVGCGCAFIDYDNDGWLDIFVLSGTRWKAIRPGRTNRLYQEQSRRHVHRCDGESRLLRSGWASAVCVGDYNNDGFDDLFVTYWGQNVLYRNNGDGTFTDVTEESRPAASGSARWGSGCTFVDYDRDGQLDLFVANYLDFDLEQDSRSRARARICNWKGIPVNCGPRGLPPGNVRALSQQRRRHLHRCEREIGRDKSEGQLLHDGGGRRFR